MRVNRNVPRMHDAGSLAAVVGAAEVDTVVAVVDVDFAFVRFESGSSEHAARSTPVATIAICGVKREARPIVQAGWRERTRSTTSSNDATRSTSRSGWKS
jgi:hypothetical protein